jgi:hypothetical protein
MGEVYRRGRRERGTAKLALSRQDGYPLLTLRVDEAHHLSPEMFDFTPHQTLHQRVAVRYHLRLTDSQNQIFSDGFVASVYDYTKGITRQINDLCHSALLLGLTETKPILDETDLKRVIHDLDGQFG